MRRKSGGADHSLRTPIRILLTLALILLLVILAQLALLRVQAKRAAGDASTLLAAVKDEMAASPAPAEETVSPDGEASPSGTELPADPTPGPEPDPAHEGNTGNAAVPDDPELAAALAQEEEGADPDPLADYVQPDAPETEDRSAAIEMVKSRIGDSGVIGILSIPSIEQELPVIAEWNYSLLKISVCRYDGPDANREGNLIILGHNYKNGSHFGRLDRLKIGDQVILTDLAGEAVTYLVYAVDIVEPTDLDTLNRYEGRMALTLVTCTDSGNSRRVVRCAPSA